MSYIIIQEDEDPLDIENISVLPEEKELKVKKFKKEEDAIRFLARLGIEDDLNYDTKIVRLH
jgi:phosphosulfolactate phosphohydrolase-like enzyme|tara:strand:+ start:1647 stop:1832 length:186 start_codon:yes stop_codon:yes gene_type:complete